MKCESCGIPLDEETKSKHDERYCIYCQNQETEEMSTYEEVREGSIGATMRLMGNTQEEAESVVDDILPDLPRWKDV